MISATDHGRPQRRDGKNCLISNQYLQMLRTQLCFDSLVPALIHQKWLIWMAAETLYHTVSQQIWTLYGEPDRILVFISLLLTLLPLRTPDRLSCLLRDFPWTCLHLCCVVFFPDRGTLSVDTVGVDHIGLSPQTCEAQTWWQESLFTSKRGGKGTSRQGYKQNSYLNNCWTTKN